MELMSSLLLCALAALFPQSLGIVPGSSIPDIKLLSAKLIEIPAAKTVWFKRKAPSEVSLDTVLEYLQHSDQCLPCVECINKALNFFSNTKSTAPPPKHMINRDYFNEIIENYHQYNIIRGRRDTGNIISRKANRSQISTSKNVIVTKYNIAGQVYAIKLRERNITDNENKETNSCNVYSVKKYYPCESTEADLVLTSPKIKNNRSKKQAKHTLTTDKPQLQSLAVRDKGIAEPFLTSIEELYN